MTPSRPSGHKRTFSSTSARTANTSPYPTSSTPDYPDYDHDVANKTASRIMTSVRRSLLGSIPKNRAAEQKRIGMITTPAENRPSTPSRYRDHDLSASRPTVEQIAMGLHISRTPHLRYSPPSGPLYQHTHPYDKSPRPFVLPPPPRRSSMKQRGASNSNATASPASASSTTVTSHISPSSHSSSSSSPFHKLRVSRFFPKLRNASSAPSSISSTASSTRGCDDALPPKKAVRFSSGSEDEA